MSKSSKLSIHCATLLFSLTFVAACTPSGGDTPPGEKPPINDGGATAAEGGEVDPPPSAASTKITVASVQMIQDCPDTEVEAAPAEAAPADEHIVAQGARAQPYTPGGSPGDGPGFHQPCDQSTVQLALETTSESPIAVEIKAVRLLSKSKKVGTLETRKPKIWTNNTYETWDQQITAGAPIKASYKLSMPNWSDVEKAIGETSFGHMFTLEIDVLVDGTVQTVSSPQFPREEQHVIVT